MPQSRTRRSPKSLSPSRPASLPPKLPRLKQSQKPKRPQSPKHLRRPGKRLLSFDRRLGARVVDGDERSAAIAAASVVAKVTRDRLMRRLDALFPQYGFVSHVGYITPGHAAVVRERGPCEIHRRSFQALCYLPADEARARIDA